MSLRKNNGNIFLCLTCCREKNSDAKAKIKMNIIIKIKRKKVSKQKFSSFSTNHRINHCRAVPGLAERVAIFGWLLFELGFLI